MCACSPISDHLDVLSQVITTICWNTNIFIFKEEKTVFVVDADVLATIPQLPGLGLECFSFSLASNRVPNYFLVLIALLQDSL